MTRARGDEEMPEEEEGVEALDFEEGSFRTLVLEWNGPDLVYSTVKDWFLSDQSGKPTVGNFFQYCFTFSENLEEDYELNLWMLNLVAHYVAEEESWMDSADDAKDWGSLLLNGEWEIPPPVWAKSRAREQVLEEKEIVPVEEKKEKTEERLEGITSSPLDPSWGKGLPAPSPASFSDVVTASRSNLSMLHTTSLDSIFWQKRAFWGGCGSWGNKIPMA